MKKLLKSYIPKQNTKVSLFVVGAQKAGTTAIHNYLISHPNIIGGNKKEINYFNHLEKFKKGNKWYHNQYERPLFFKPKKVYIDSTPQYLSESGIAKKIYNYNKNAFIVVLLRNPVERAFSSWNMYKQFSEMNKKGKAKLIKKHINPKNVEDFRNLINKQPFYTFEEFVNLELQNNELVNHYPNILKRGIYVNQIQPYLKLFDFNKVLIYESKDFKNNKLKVTNSILNKLSLEGLKADKIKLKPIHSRDYETGISEKTNQKLRKFYAPYNKKLFKLIHQKFDW